MAPPTPDPLATQLSRIFSAGLESDPELRASLSEALSSFTPDSSSLPERTTKTEANYRPAEEGSNERCDTCDYYNPGDFTTDPSCSVVAGRINLDYVSNEYKPANESTTGSDTSSSAEARLSDDGVLPDDLHESSSHSRPDLAGV